MALIGEGKHEQISIEEEMKNSYLDYAMSVIVGRALPDVRDGLKPVHRRVLFAMSEMGNVHNKPPKKSARIVGDVIGKYHPHGDAAVYDTIVRMAQDFSMRYTLVDGQGNFGSIDGDPPAAMRYTEVRLTALAGEFLEDIDKDTVEFGPNYDNTMKEPLILPAQVPNLLLNGAGGIAVGMATNIPPHNLTELADGIIAMIKNPKITVDKLMKFVSGPDFPTGGIICGDEGIKQAYRTGRGKLVVRSRVATEAMKGNRERLVVTELPYQVNKARLMESIAKLVQERKLEGISDIRDESDREGMRMVIELKRDVNPQILLNKLFKLTQMQISFGIIMLALVHGRPKVITLAEALSEFISFRKEVVTRRCIYLLEKARAKAHILEGLKVALDNIDAVIQLIRKAKDPATAKDGLMKNFKLSAIQAQAILDMRLQRLTNLERNKILDELKATLARIKELETILSDDQLIYGIVSDEMREVKKKFGDERRTEITAKAEEFVEENVIPEEKMVVTISHQGYIKRSPVSMYRSQKRGGRGKLGMGVRDDDFPETMFVASTHSYLLIFTDAGRAYWLKVHQLPQMGRTTKGKHVASMVKMKEGENLTAILPVREFVEGQFVLLATKNGMIKKSSLMDFSNPRSSGIIACNLKKGDSLIAARLTTGKQEIFLATKKGQGIRFPEKQVRVMGRSASGVRGMSLGSGDEVIGMIMVDDKASLLTVTEHGYGKLTELSEFRGQGRGGKGIIATKVNQKNGPMVSISQVKKGDDVMIITDHAKIIRLHAEDISTYGRNAQGVRIIKVSKGEKVTAAALAADEDKAEDEEASAQTELV